MIKVGVGAVVLNNDKILLVRRLNPPCRNKWAIPGGHVEENETLSRAASRELLEETGIRAEAIGAIWIDEILPDDCPDNETKTHYILIDILMKPLSGELRASSDAGDAAFFPMRKPPSETTSTTLKLVRYLAYNNGRVPIIPVR